MLDGDNLKIVSLNVRGLGHFKKRRSIFSWARRTRADLVLLQETHSTAEIELKWQHECGGQILFSHGNSSSRGVAIIVQML